MTVDSFVVEAAVIHDVPRRDEETDLTLTDAPIALDAQLRGYFRRKIVDSLTLRGLDVVADPTGSAAVRDAVAAILTDQAQLVEASKAVALHLDDSQNRRNPAGLLAVVLGHLDSGPALAILKLEREQGLRLRIQEVGGQVTVDLQFLRDLTLTDKTRIFKTSILQLEAAGDSASMFGRVAGARRVASEQPTPCDELHTDVSLVRRWLGWSSCSLSKRLSEQADIGRHGAGIWLNQALCPTAFLRVGQSRNPRSRRS